MDEIQHAFFEMHSHLPAFTRKAEQARAIVANALTQMSNPYIAFSTGKDSLVTAHLVWQHRPDVPAVYFDADCAFPESSDLLDRLSQEHTVITWPCEPLLDTFERCGGLDVPGIGKATMESTVYTPIRSLLETYQFDGVFLGLRTDESEGRANTAKYHGTLYRYKRDEVLRCLPVAHFSYRDIWASIVSRNLDYNRAYDKMWNLPEEDRRVSYWAGETKRRWGRFVFLKECYPELFNRFAARFPEVRQFV